MPNSENYASYTFRAAMALFIFILGGVFANNNYYPYRWFNEGYIALKEIIIERRQNRPSILSPHRYQGDGVTRHEPSRVYEGLTLMQGIWAEGVGLRLVDMAGNIVNQWPANFYGVWPNPSHVFPKKILPSNDFHYHTHGMGALPDGSVVFNFAELGTVKMDKCGVVQWTVDRMTHHSVTPTSDGSFWIPVKGDARDVPEALFLPGISRNVLLNSSGLYEDRLMRVDSTGQIKEELSVLQALFDGGFERELYDAGTIKKHDPTHVNDIDVVTAALAEKIDGVEIGDLLISIRQMHMLAILDRVTGRIKWHHIGPWIRQHDPDITPEGNIVVFNNGSEKLHLNRISGSNLISLDPASGQTTILYPRTGQPPFFTSIMGAAQPLPNGNHLITETKAGRVFEIDSQGAIVWEYVKPYNETHSSVIESAIRYDKRYFQVTDWNCN